MQGKTHIYSTNLVDLYLFQQLSILSIKNLYVYSVQIFLYKYYRQSIPIIFSGFFTTKYT